MFIKILPTPNLEFNLFFPLPRNQYLFSVIIYAAHMEMIEDLHFGVASMLALVCGVFSCYLGNLSI